MSLGSILCTLENLIKALLSHCLSMLLGLSIQLGKFGLVHPGLKESGQRHLGQCLSCTSMLPLGHDNMLGDDIRCVFFLGIVGKWDWKHSMATLCIVGITSSSECWTLVRVSISAAAVWVTNSCHSGVFKRLAICPCRLCDGVTPQTWRCWCGANHCFRICAIMGTCPTSPWKGASLAYKTSFETPSATCLRVMMKSILEQALACSYVGPSRRRPCVQSNKSMETHKDVNLPLSWCWALGWGILSSEKLQGHCVMQPATDRSWSLRLEPECSLQQGHASADQVDPRAVFWLTVVVSWLHRCVGNTLSSQWLCGQVGPGCAQDVLGESLSISVGLPCKSVWQGCKGCPALHVVDLQCARNESLNHSRCSQISTLFLWWWLLQCIEVASIPSTHPNL